MQKKMKQKLKKQLKQKNKQDVIKVQKKKPLRTCMGCNNPNEKNELLRIVKSKEGEISVD